MKERPILFSAPMVRAILAGTKTQTRRAVKGWPLEWLSPPISFSPEYVAHPENDACPYGQPGDRLWVREAWGYRCSSGTPVAGQYHHTIQYRADDERHTFGPMAMDGVGLPKWRERDEGMSYEAWDARMTAYWRQWRPSIHMPRWASRITLEVTGVRVERLQDISEEDAIAEGVDRFPGCRRDDDAAAFNRIGPVDNDSFPIARYAVLWEQINGAGSWDANPWVWCVEFKQAEAAHG